MKNINTDKMNKYEYDETRYLVVSECDGCCGANDDFGCEESFRTKEDAVDYIREQYERGVSHVSYKVVEIAKSDLDEIDGFDPEVAEELRSKTVAGKWYSEEDFETEDDEDDEE